ncbi:nicotinate phosphoribosyltransferase [Clostridium carboxidivorans P7]|uniref:Nicotinate phosphoribosyltransferase n=1 Tax=Clostridium carboxidivorans P7 TaxID=536227 RepID=C6Q0I5_9CLOT|nr:nicotinate phosphoribosyltransferase [Clostridium carboxidivorans P7]
MNLLKYLIQFLHRKKKKIKDYYVKELMVKIFDKGVPIYENPNVMDIKKVVEEETSKMWPEVLRFENPHTYYVDLSKKLWDLKQDLLHKYSNTYEE